MMCMTENLERELLSLLKRDDDAGLKVITGPDGRLRLVVDKSSWIENKKDYAIFPVQGDTNTPTVDIPINASA